jgi:divinyl protochlorophyllide a 8-vinyl-reductase
MSMRIERDMTDAAISNPTRAPQITGRIGPNAIIRMAEAIERHEGNDAARRMLQAAGLGAYIAARPENMVDEREVIRLHRVVRAEYGATRADLLSRVAGLATGDYLLANRIPKPVQTLLKLLPARLAAHVLVTAIGKHAWTFCGSGRFEAAFGPIGSGRLRLAVIDGPLSRGVRSSTPVCAYYAATFERLFRALVHRRVTVEEIECQAAGGSACVFEVRWRQ